MATTLSFADLRQSAKLFMAEWSSLTVRDEVLMPVGVDGMVFMSFWDNWLLPPDPDGIEPIFMRNGFVMEEGTDYTLLQAGDSIRTKIQLVSSEGLDAIIMATYRRSMFRNSFWDVCIRQATNEIHGRLMTGKTVWPAGDITLDAENDPWTIIIKQAGKNALCNLQTFLAGLGRTQMENISIDLTKAHSVVHEVIKSLEQDIDRDVVAWRWKSSPVARGVSMSALPGPGPLWGGMY